MAREGSGRTGFSAAPPPDASKQPAPNREGESRDLHDQPKMKMGHRSSGRQGFLPAPRPPPPSDP
eukprot:CAMPEP_0174833434 /NCGR_PEP_ID=MMETSP1114-20130205/4238_1 /TAXON_ID=312471 /ORGANISM="Neobodo designis, Strain CCAP 1951/1" /LENGTH=64 /DNA_ID=CAMNT_0016067317 /DNA_START=295 /DNA_END=489 /DNA_ORIENTATION=-